MQIYKNIPILQRLTAIACMYKFQPIYKTTVWGGERIAPFKGVENGLTHVGESWELSGIPGSESVVIEGYHVGATLPELVAREGVALLGRKNLAQFGEEFPLLIKLIDARKDLSIQVHPDDALAMARHRKKGKTEMWYILDAEPEASLIAGFSQMITPHEYDELISEGRITDVLARHTVAVGDCFFLPAGRIHTIGAGILLVEIQQASDVTYRVYDYGRLGLDGKPRELHIDEAREAIDYHLYDHYHTYYETHPNQGNELVRCDYFTTALYELTEVIELPIAPLDSFVVVIALEGAGSLSTEDGRTISIRQGETILVAAHHQSLTLRPHGKLKLLTAYCS